MEKLDVCVLVRVYDRVDDLDCCIHIMEQTWNSFDYYKLVVSNGRKNGYRVSKFAKNRVNHLAELEENAGHLKGNAQLLTEGLSFIPEYCSYLIILEADTWIYSDKIIKKYIARMRAEKAVWASAQWYSGYHSLATDFAIIDTAFLKKNCQIFQYTGFPECYAANYILEVNQKFIYIRENMPVHIPGYLKKFPFTYGGRFNIFPGSQMVTHHIEKLTGGIEEKKAWLNIFEAGFYPTSYHLKQRFWISRFFIKCAMMVVCVLPKKSWFTRVKKLKI